MKTEELDKLNKPYKIYTDYVEDGAMRQFLDVMSLPTTVQGALMPDVHQGYTMPIGAVVACKDVVHPAFVGFDISCGLTSFKLINVTKEDIINNAESIFNNIKELVPVGNNKHQYEKSVAVSALNGLTGVSKSLAIKRDYINQLGTLGGGNHFIEVGYDEEDNVWVTVHSGSRGTGHAIATHYMKLASAGVEGLGEVTTQLEKKFYLERQDLFKHNHPAYVIAEKKYVNKGLEKYLKNSNAEGLASFTKGTEEYSNYMQDMYWCCNYAKSNRKTMLNAAVQAIVNVVGRVKVKVIKIVNTNHNHAVESETGVIHRKGSAPAEEGEYNIIPANMRDGVYLVKGKGCKEALNSSSHGAGRVLGRNQAKKTLDLEEFLESMKDVQSSADEARLDEAPLAYKNIVKVLADQEELVEVIAHIKPLINIKG